MAQVRILKGTTPGDLVIARASETADSVQLASIGLGTASASAGIAVGGASTPGVSGAGTGRIYFDSTSNTFKVSENGGSYTNMLGGGGGMSIGGAVSGGTVGSVLYVGSGAVLSQDNSNLFYNDSTKRFGVGTSSPSYPIHAKGSSNPYIVVETTGTSGVAGIAGTNTGGSFGVISVTGTGWTAGDYGADASYGLARGTDGMTVNADAGEVRLSRGTSGATIGMKMNTSNYMEIPGSGRLGIGTASPSQQIDIVGSTTRFGRARVTSTGSGDSAGWYGENSAGATAAVQAVSTGWTSGSYGADASYGLVRGSDGLAVNADTQELRFSRGTGGATIGLKMNTSNYMEIPSSGRLGINVNPVRRLHIRETSTDAWAQTEITQTGGYNAAWLAYNGTNYGQYGVVASSGWTAGELGADSGYAIIYGDAGIAMMSVSGEIRLTRGTPGSGSTVVAKVNTSNEFQIIGNLTKIRNVTYSWPSSQGAANTVLTDDGSGNLSWSTAAATRSYSELYYDNETGTTITVTTAGTYYAFAGSTLSVGQQDTGSNLVGSGSSNNFTVGTNGAGDYFVTANISHVGPNNAVVHVALAVNGTVVAKTRSERKQAGTAHSGMISCSGVLALAATDTVDVRLTSDTNGDTLTVYHVNFSAHRVST